MNFKKAITIFINVVIAFAFNNATAQLCQGSVGDPVVNISFGSGANPGQTLGAAVNTYSYVSNGCPNDGSYTISNSVNGCFNGSWFDIAEDHTPNNVNGYMMVVNATFTPGDFYLETVAGLCSGTTYEFASWIMNIQKGNSCGGNPIHPNVTFNIETSTGTILATHKTGDIPFSNTPTWTQYGAYFTTPPGVTDVVLRITNNAPGGCGNDVALDDITFRPCGPLVAATISGYGNSKDVCVGDTSTFVLTANVSNSYNNQFYQWQVSIDSGKTWTDIAGATSTTYTRKSGVSAGLYKYRLAIAQGSNIALSTCRVVSNVVTVNVNALPVPAASNSSPSCEGDAVTLTAKAASTFNWNGRAGFTSASQSPVINNALLNTAGKYYVTVTSNAGCINSDSTIVSIYKRPLVNAGSDTIICEGKSTILQGNGVNIVSYLWSPSTGLSSVSKANPIASPVDSTMYVLTVMNGVCSNRDSVLIKVLKKPVADAGADKKITEGQSIMLIGTAKGNNISYNWTPVYNITSASTLQPIVSPTADTTYTLHVTSNNGCGTAADNVFVRVYKRVIVPNAFSPNRDGVNDTWNIQALVTYPNAEVHVYNRYGQVVFSSKGYAKPWDGIYNAKSLPVGVYYYVIDLKENLDMLTGWVMILR